MSLIGGRSPVSTEPEYHEARRICADHGHDLALHDDFCTQSYRDYQKAAALRVDAAAKREQRSRAMQRPQWAPVPRPPSPRRVDSNGNARLLATQHEPDGFRVPLLVESDGTEHGSLFDAFGP